jgi:hypothetical protein
VCAGGLHREGETCVEKTPVTAAVVPVDSEPQATPPGPAGEDSPRAEGTKRAQRCFTELGLYKGSIDGVANRDTWTAYWYFKHANGLNHYSDYLAAPVQEKIAALCKDGAGAATLTTEPAPATAEETRPRLPVAQEIAAPRKTSLDIDCLPADLLALLRRSHGRAVTVKACLPACLPAPRGLDQSELAALEARSGVDWCSGCVAIDGRLALEDVQRIERAGNVKLCATPPRQLPRHMSSTEPGEKAYTRVRELYRSLPPAAEDETAIAIVIGNRNYATLPGSETSRNDADAIYSVLTEHLGYLQDNVILLHDAKKADFDRLFGTASEPGGELAGLVRAHPGATVLLYYSGLGATDAAQTDTYLLPVDA